MDSLISKEKLIEMYSLSESDYNGIDLDLFIQDYEITDESAGKLNVKALLALYETEVDFSYLFDNNAPKRNADFTSDIKYLAVYKNTAGSTKCVFADLYNKKIYRDAYEYIFNDVSQYPSSDLSETDVQSILEKLADADVFSWQSVRSENPQITDFQKAAVTVLYSDNSRFQVDFSGLLSDCMPPEFDLLLDFLFQIG